MSHTKSKKKKVWNQSKNRSKSTKTFQPLWKLAAWQHWKRATELTKSVTFLAGNALFWQICMVAKTKTEIRKNQPILFLTQKTKTIFNKFNDIFAVLAIASLSVQKFVPNSATVWQEDYAFQCRAKCLNILLEYIWSSVVQLNISSNKIFYKLLILEFLESYEINYIYKIYYSFSKICFFLKKIGEFLFI